MSNFTLDQKCSIGCKESANTAANLQKKRHSSITEGSILERLFDFAISIPDFRRTSKGNLRHKLSDIIILMILGRMSNHTSRADIIEFGRHNINKLRSLGLLKSGVPSEPTLCRIESGLDSSVFASKMAEFVEKFHTELLKSKNPIPEIICVDGKAMRGTTLENGRNPDIVGAYSPATGLVLATEACQEKSNEIKAVPLLLDKVNIAGKLVTADAMSMQKDIIDKIKGKRGNFLIELKANQRSLRYGVEDRIKEHSPLSIYRCGPELSHGRIEERTYKVFDGLELIADKDKWGGNLTVVEFTSETVEKSTGATTTETRLYLSSLPVNTKWIGSAIRQHWSIESMHWGLDLNFEQDNIKRKTSRAARNLDTIQRIAYNLFSIWKGRRKKLTDKAKGIAELMRGVSMGFTRLIRFLSQK